MNTTARSQTRNSQTSDFKTNAVANAAHIIEKNGEVFVFSNLNDNAALDLPFNLKQIKELRDFANYRSCHYNRVDGEPFQSAKLYAKLIKTGIKYLGFERIREFFYGCSLDFLFKHYENLKRELKTQCNNKKKVYNIECAFLSYINYLQFMDGTHDPYGNKRDKRVKVTLLSSKHYLQNAA